MAEVTGPIIATTAVLMAVFVPVAFIPGVAGRLYNQFALTVAISVGISAFNSLTLSPAFSAALLRHTPRGKFFLFPLVQRRLRLRWRTAMRGPCKVFIRFGWALIGSCSSRSRAAPTRCRATFPRPSCRSRTRAISSWWCNCRTERRYERTDEVAQEGPRHPAGDAGRRDRRLHQRAQLPHQRGAVELRGRIRGSQTLGRARTFGKNASALVAAVRPKLLAIPGGVRAELRSAFDQRARHDGRL